MSIIRGVVKMYVRSTILPNEAFIREPYYSKPPKILDYVELNPNPEIQFNKFNKSFAESVMDQTNIYGKQIWKDKTFPNIFYNYIYQTIDYKPYIIVNRFCNRGMSSKNWRNVKLKIQSLLTGSIMIKPYFMFFHGDIDLKDDPYDMVLCNNMGCLGNINYEPLGVTTKYKNYKVGSIMYEIWCEMMARCYNPNHPLGEYYQNLGCLPRVPRWNCFRWFYIDFDTWYHYTNLYPDPNDMMLYTTIDKPTVREMKKIASEGRKLNPSLDRTPEHLRKVPFPLRPNTLYRLPGTQHHDRYSIDPSTLSPAYYKKYFAEHNVLSEPSSKDLKILDKEKYDSMNRRILNPHKEYIPSRDPSKKLLYSVLDPSKG